MKKLTLAFLIGLSITGIFMQYSSKVSKDISNNILRLHIVANSNTPADQNLKLKVRDSIISYLSNNLKNNYDLNQTKSFVKQHLQNLQDIAKQEVVKNGYSYDVTANIGIFSFPTKYYENFTLPRGDYDALRVAIGNGKGNNWWCVLYPNLCFVDGTVAMPKSSMQKLKGVLTEDEISLISDTNKFPVAIKFKLVEIFSNLHI